MSEQLMPERRAEAIRLAQEKLKRSYCEERNFAIARALLDLDLALNDAGEVKRIKELEASVKLALESCADQEQARIKAETELDRRAKRIYELEDDRQFLTTPERLSEIIDSKNAVIAEQEKRLDAASYPGHYISTACQRDKHEHCRYRDKWDAEPCQCKCGHLRAVIAPTYEAQAKQIRELEASVKLALESCADQEQARIKAETELDRRAKRIYELEDDRQFLTTPERLSEIIDSKNAVIAEQEKRLDAASYPGHYISTACQRDKHEHCRYRDKWDAEPCQCKCGHLRAVIAPTYEAQAKQIRELEASVKLALESCADQEQARIKAETELDRRQAEIDRLREALEQPATDKESLTVAPFTVTDESLVPGDLCTATVTMPCRELNYLVEMASIGLRDQFASAMDRAQAENRFDAIVARSVRVPDLALIAERLNRPCAKCCGNIRLTICSACGELAGAQHKPHCDRQGLVTLTSAYDDPRNEIICPECRGTGKQSVPGVERKQENAHVETIERPSVLLPPDFSSPLSSCEIASVWLKINRLLGLLSSRSEDQLMPSGTRIDET